MAGRPKRQGRKEPKERRDGAARQRSRPGTHRSFGLHARQHLIAVCLLASACGVSYVCRQRRVLQFLAFFFSCCWLFSF
uniref:Uncharacterized protein n=1 Tax=Setaria italica TaxID=4555 RepID=K3XNW9_SETIT